MEGLCRMDTGATVTRTGLKVLQGKMDSLCALRCSGFGERLWKGAIANPGESNQTEMAIPTNSP